MQLVFNRTHVTRNRRGVQREFEVNKKVRMPRYVEAGLFDPCLSLIVWQQWRGPLSAVRLRSCERRKLIRINTFPGRKVFEPGAMIFLHSRNENFAGHRHGGCYAPTRSLK